MPGIIIDQSKDCPCDVSSRINDHNNHDTEPLRFRDMASDVFQGIKEGRLHYVHDIVATDKRCTCPDKMSQLDVTADLGEYTHESKTEPKGDKQIRVIAIYEDNRRDIAAALVVVNEPKFQGDYHDRFALFDSDYMGNFPGLYLSFINYLYNLPDIPEAFLNDPAPMDAIATYMRQKTDRAVNPAA